MNSGNHDVEIRGFVDVRLDDVGEWGEEDPGAFMAKDGIEQLMLWTCTAGNVTLAWSSDKIGLYTDPACEEQHKVAEDESSLEGSRRATFTPQYATPQETDTPPANKGQWPLAMGISGYGFR